MRLTELSKKVSRQKLQLIGHFSNEELYELRGNGWWIEWQEKPRRRRKGKPQTKPQTKPKMKITQMKKNGIAVERVV